MNILLLEDEKTIREVLCEYMKMTGYTVFQAEDGEQAIDILAKESIDLAVLDIMVPKIDGLQVLEHIHRRYGTPAIMLTALDDEQTQLTAFNTYADDYVVKPCSPIILLKRIETILRRSKKSGEQSQGLVLDKGSYTAHYKGKNLKLTLSEYLLLEALYNNKDKVLKREQLIYAIYENDYFGSDRVIDSHVKNLRKKLPLDCIQTVSGIGYRFQGGVE